MRVNHALPLLLLLAPTTAGAQEEAPEVEPSELETYESQTHEDGKQYDFVSQERGNKGGNKDNGGGSGMPQGLQELLEKLMGNGNHGNSEPVQFFTVPPGGGMAAPGGVGGLTDAIKLLKSVSNKQDQQAELNAARKKRRMSVLPKVEPGTPISTVLQEMRATLASLSALSESLGKLLAGLEGTVPPPSSASSSSGDETADYEARLAAEASARERSASEEDDEAESSSDGFPLAKMLAKALGGLGDPQDGDASEYTIKVVMGAEDGEEREMEFTAGTSLTEMLEVFEGRSRRASSSSSSSSEEPATSEDESDEVV